MTYVPTYQFCEAQTLLLVCHYVSVSLFRKFSYRLCCTDCTEEQAYDIFPSPSLSKLLGNIMFEPEQEL